MSHPLRGLFSLKIPFFGRRHFWTVLDSSLCGVWASWQDWLSIRVMKISFNMSRSFRARKGIRESGNNADCEQRWKSFNIKTLNTDRFKIQFAQGKWILLFWGSLMPKLKSCRLKNLQDKISSVWNEGSFQVFFRLKLCCVIF